MTVSNLASLCKTIVDSWRGGGAVNESRTRNPRNGSPMLYQLNYCGVYCFVEVTVWCICCSAWSANYGK